MVTIAEQGTAGECARRLLSALNSGSDEHIHRALDRISNLTAAESADSRELEFRDLLAGIISAQNFPSKQVMVQMLTHVATSAA